ncbi:MAG TPA: hypothetical protein VGB42_01555 [Candidatus Thermoplasmatota archaeon]
MATSVNRLVFAKPHCEVCPIFLGQPVPVVRTEHGYAIFCEVCALGHGPISVQAGHARSMEITVEDEGDASGGGYEEE